MNRAALACNIHDIFVSTNLTPAKRTLNLRLDCTRITAAFGIPRPDWCAGLHKILQELTDEA